MRTHILQPATYLRSRLVVAKAVTTTDDAAVKPYRPGILVKVLLLIHIGEVHDNNLFLHLCFLFIILSFTLQIMCQQA